jgi:hypothetical protein
MKITSLISLITAVTGLFLTSCGPQRFYQEVKTGKIESAPIVKWTGPDRFVLVYNKDAPFKFRRFNGEVIQPEPIKTDGGSIPPQFWDLRGMTPWTYAPGYLVHDWLYEANRRGQMPGGKTASGTPLHYDKELCDLILAEVIKTQMLDYETRGDGDPHPTRLFVIYNSVKLFGNQAFNGKPTLLDDFPVLTQAGDAVNSVVPEVVRTPFNTFRQQIKTAPHAPSSLEGSIEPIEEKDQ